MGDIAFIVLSLLAVLFNIAPLCWQIEHRNSGPVCLGIWVIVANLVWFVNAVVWRDDAINRAPVWCDIAVKLQLAAPLGILASDICILLLLARVVGPQAKLVSAKTRRRTAFYDYLFCFGLPIFVMVTHVIYQPFRFGISKTMGCLTPLSNTWPTWVCYFIWAPLLSFIGCLLAFYVAYRLLKHRRDFRKLVNNSGSALTTSRFVRLGLLAIAFCLFNLPLSIYSVYSSLEALGPYLDYNWDFIHHDFSYVAYYPWVERATFGYYSDIIAGMLVLVFFGFGNEALSYYIRPLRRLGLLSGPSVKAVDSSGGDIGSQDVTQISLHRSGLGTALSDLDIEDQKSDVIGLSEYPYSYSGPFNGARGCLPAQADSQGIKIQMLQEARVTQT